MNIRVLIIGRRSYASQGLPKLLTSQGVSVEAISAKEKIPEGNFDVVVNFGLPRGGGIEGTLKEIARVHEACNVQAKYLVQISSMGVYPALAGEVDEKSPMDSGCDKGPYSALKIAQDNFLLSQKRNYKLLFLRPGVIVSEDSSSQTAGVFFRLFGSFGILMGAKDTPLPIIERAKLHAKIAELIALPKEGVMILARNTTKLAFSRDYLRVYALPLPHLFCKIGMFLLPKNKAKQLQGLFIRPRVRANIVSQS